MAIQFGGTFRDSDEETCRRVQAHPCDQPIQGRSARVQLLLFEQFRIGDILGQAPFDAWGEDECRATLAGCYRWVREVTGPLNSIGDHEGCKSKAEGSSRPRASRRRGRAARVGLEADRRRAGVGRGRLARLPAGAGRGDAHRINTAFAMYAGLSVGAAEVIESFGTEEQKALYYPRMLNGRWGGTMCLTEAQAGSDVGSAKTSASNNGDGSYTIRGTKIFISAGDHDLAENIVHLVLARVEGAPAGTKGLTLFIVPRIRPNADGTLAEPNDVSLANIEHKMGINASATCILNFGDEGKCRGWPVGGEAKLNQGMPQMFKLMNSARIAVGIQGLSVASSAFLNAVEYAKERKQGGNMAHWKDPTAPRVPIIEHADVRRMLLDMKARVEGIRALIVNLLGNRFAISTYHRFDDDYTYIWMKRTKAGQNNAESSEECLAQFHITVRYICVSPLAPFLSGHPKASGITPNSEAVTCSALLGGPEPFVGSQTTTPKAGTVGGGADKAEWKGTPGVIRPLGRQAQLCPREPAATGKRIEWTPAALDKFGARRAASVAILATLPL